MLEFLDGWLAFYLAVGLAVGFFAGMLGIGGGAITVPAVTFALARQGAPGDHLVHVALGTSLAAIIFVSFSSLRAHHAHGAVQWSAVRGMLPGVVLGAAAGTWIARFIPTFPLAVIFALFVFYAATRMLMNTKPRPGAQPHGRLALAGGGFAITALSSLVAVGGAVFTIPFLVRGAMPFHHALGTAAAVGFPLALFGTVGYMINGWGQPGLPAGAIGYVHVPALVCISIGSAVLAPVGARLAHATSVKTLKRVFAFVMYAMAIKLLWGLR